MNKKDLLKEVARRSKMKEAEVTLVAETLFETIKEKLIFGLDIKIKEFVTFKHAISPEMKRVNPRTGEEMIIPKKFRIKMTLPKSFTDKIKDKTVY